MHRFGIFTFEKCCNLETLVRVHSGGTAVVMFFLNSPQDLRAPSSDHRETLHSDQYMRQLFNASPKIRGASPKNFTIAKFGVDFTQPPNFIANISGMSEDIQNRKDTVIENNFSRVRRMRSGEL